MVIEGDRRRSRDLHVVESSDCPGAAEGTSFTFEHDLIPDDLRAYAGALRASEPDAPTVEPETEPGPPETEPDTLPVPSQDPTPEFIPGTEPAPDANPVPDQCPIWRHVD